MARPPEADLEALIDALLGADVRFIVVGGAAAVLHGAPTTTQDLDVLIERSTENARRLAPLLLELGAHLRDTTDRHLKPTEALLLAVRQVQLATRYGPLDLLGELHDGRDFPALLEKSIVLEDGERQIRVIDLPTLIEVKASTGRARDRLLLPILLALLQE